MRPASQPPPPPAGESIESPGFEEASPRRRWTGRARRHRGWIAVLTVLAATVALTWFVTRPDGPAPLTAADVADQVQSALEAQERESAQQPPTAVAVNALLAPSLVTIVGRGVDGDAPQSGGAGDGNSLGSGVVVKADGTILTADHVVTGASRIEVTFADGTTSRAEVVESNPATDTAVLSVESLPSVVVPATLGGGARVGDDVYALGNPLGLRHSFTAGVVSALDRRVSVNPNRSLDGLIQFDAAVNPGNSGGPLTNSAGQVIGIVTGLANPTDESFFIGIGFAVPISSAGGGGDIPAL